AAVPIRHRHRSRWPSSSARSRLRPRTGASVGWWWSRVPPSSWHGRRRPHTRYWERFQHSSSSFQHRVASRRREVNPRPRSRPRRRPDGPSRLAVMTPSPPEEGSVGHAAGPPPESPQPYRRPTLDEVARRAGVSRSVASRARNNTRDVRPANRDAVEQASAALGDTAHASARALATSRVGSVVLAVLDEEPEHFGEPYFSQVVVGITTVLTAAELDLTLWLASTRESRARLERLLRSHEADGVMMMAPRGEETLVAVADS